MVWPRRAAVLVGLLLLAACGGGTGTRADDQAVLRADPAAAPRSGCGRRQDDPVMHALRWLAAHQAPDGRFPAGEFGAWCQGQPAEGDPPDGPGRAEHDLGTTALAVLAFLGAGYTNRGAHEFAQPVRLTLRWLQASQDEAGSFARACPRADPVDRAWAALALIEAYGMTEGVWLLEAARRSLRWVIASRDPDGLWRAPGVSSRGAESWTCWMALCLLNGLCIDSEARTRGREAPFDLDPDLLAPTEQALERQADPRTGCVGCGTEPHMPQAWAAGAPRWPGDSPAGLTATLLTLRLHRGEPPAEPLVQAQAAALLGASPSRDAQAGSADFGAWLLDTRAVFEAGGKPWDAWDEGLQAAVVVAQRMEGGSCGYRGSWDPTDAWGAQGGRVYATAMLCLCLELYYRYDRRLTCRPG